MKTSTLTSVLLLCASTLLQAAVPDPNTRAIWFCAESAADPTVRAARDELMSSGAPLLKALASTHATGESVSKDDLLANPAKKEVWVNQALQNLVFLGTPDEGATSARLCGFTYGIEMGKHEMWRLGIGRLQGDVGYVETSFNPYLYSDKFDDNPYSTLLVRIGGTTPKGVALAAKAFAAGMNNGVVAGEGVRRTETTILDLDPSTTPPPKLPMTLPGGFVWAGWSQSPAQEYRAYMEYGAKVQPTHVWRVKYLEPGALDTASPAAWLHSPITMSWGNAVTIAQFADAADAKRAFEGLLKETRNTTKMKVGEADAFSVPFPKDEAIDIPGRIVYWAQGSYLVSSSLPDTANGLLRFTE